MAREPDADKKLKLFLWNLNDTPAQSQERGAEILRWSVTWGYLDRAEGIDPATAILHEEEWEEQSQRLI